MHLSRNNHTRQRLIWICIAAAFFGVVEAEAATDAVDLAVSVPQIDSGSVSVQVSRKDQNGGGGKAILVEVRFLEAGAVVPFATQHVRVRPGRNVLVSAALKVSVAAVVVEAWPAKGEAVKEKSPGDNRQASTGGTAANATVPTQAAKIPKNSASKMETVIGEALKTLPGSLPSGTKEVASESSSATKEDEPPARDPNPSAWERKDYEISAPAPEVAPAGPPYDITVTSALTLVGGEISPAAPGGPTTFTPVELGTGGLVLVGGPAPELPAPPSFRPVEVSTSTLVLVGE